MRYWDVVDGNIVGNGMSPYAEWNMPIGLAGIESIDYGFGNRPTVTGKLITTYKEVKMEKVIFNDPATIVFWSDGTKTVVKANNEEFDKEKGLAMAISKKFFGNKGRYFNIFKKYCTRGESDE